MGNVSVKQCAHKNKTRRHKLKNNTASNKPTINKRRRNKTRRGGAPSSLRKSITNRDGNTVTNSEVLHTVSKPTKHTPSVKFNLKSRRKKLGSSLSNSIRSSQKHRVGEPGSIRYSITKPLEKQVLPVINLVNSLFK